MSLDAKKKLSEVWLYAAASALAGAAVMYAATRSDKKSSSAPKKTQRPQKVRLDWFMFL